jgi:hypothetical protein
VNGECRAIRQFDSILSLFDSVRSSSSRENCTKGLNARPDSGDFTADQWLPANACLFVGESDRRRPIDAAQSRNLIMTRTMRVGMRIAAALVALAPLRAVAQQNLDLKAFQREEPVRAEPVRIQVGVNLFFPGPTGESEDAVRLRDRVRRSIYEMAAGECSLVEQVLAKTCRLEAVNVNININRQSGQGEGYQANGNFTLRVSLK